MLEIMMNLKFLEAEYTPIKSRCGWAVPLKYTKKAKELYMCDLIENMDAIGLKRNNDYRVFGHSRYGDEIVTRVTFDTDEAFLIAKMYYG